MNSKKPDLAKDTSDHRSPSAEELKEIAERLAREGRFLPFAVLLADMDEMAARLRQDPDFQETEGETE